MIDLIIARIIHVIGIVIWIGGVALITTVILPAVKKFKSANERLEFFEKIEHKFSIQARIATVFVGLSGFHMVARLKAWDRFLDPSYWWMHAMVLVWLVFTLMLFVFEPLFLKKKMMQHAKANPEDAYKKMFKMHLHLLLLSIITIIGAVAGSRGWLFF